MASDAPPAGGPGLKFRLSVMMFLQFFIWGAWFPLVFPYVPSLGFSGWQVWLTLSMFNLSALIAMFFSNQFADRNFAAQKFLAFSHLVGGLGIFGLAFVKSGWTANLFGIHINASFWAFLALMAVHTLFYVPTISITNAIAFANMRDSKEFGMIRLWGTIGWIAAAWPFVFVLVDWDRVPSIGEGAAVVKAADGSTVGVIPVTMPTLGRLQRRAFTKPEEVAPIEVAGVKIEPNHRVEMVETDFWLWLKTALGTAKKDQAFKEATRFTFLAAGLASLLLAAFSLILPHTPPKPAPAGGEKFAWLEAMKLLKHPFILVLFIVTFVDAAVHQSYFYWTAEFLEKGVKLPTNWIMPAMSIGQVAEIATMAILGFVLRTLGWRFTMVVGILGHAGRFAVFAFAQQLPPEYQQ